jgi:phage terminase large subunit-like protein
VLTRDEVTRRLTGDRGQALRRLSWSAEVDAARADPRIRVVALWMPRQSGKTQELARQAISELLTVPNASILFLSAGREQAETIFARKFRQPMLRLLKAAGLPASAIKMTQSSAENAASNSVLEVVSPTEDTSVSRSVTLLLIDEGRFVADKTFAAVVLSVIGANGTVVVASTPGELSGFFHGLCTSGDPEVRVIRVDANENPYASAEAIGFLQRLLHKILPSAAARDIGNKFTDDAGVYIDPASYAKCECPGWSPVMAGDPEVPPLFVAADLGLKDDNAAVLRVFVDPETRQVIVAGHRIWKPVKGETLDIAATVESHLRELHLGFRLATVRYDPWQFERSAQQLRAEGLPMEAFPQTPANLTKMAITLLELIKYQNLVVYPNADDLKEHVLNAVAVETSYGLKLAKEKSSRKVDACVALAMACVAATERPVPEPARMW